MLGREDESESAWASAKEFHDIFGGVGTQIVEYYPDGFRFGICIIDQFQKVDEVGTLVRRDSPKNNF